MAAGRGLPNVTRAVTRRAYRQAFQSDRAYPTGETDGPPTYHNGPQIFAPFFGLGVESQPYSGSQAIHDEPNDPAQRKCTIKTAAARQPPLKEEGLEGGDTFISDDTSLKELSKWKPKEG